MYGKCTPFGKDREWREGYTTPALVNKGALATYIGQGLVSVNRLLSLASIPIPILLVTFLAYGTKSKKV